MMEEKDENEKNMVQAKKMMYGYLKFFATIALVIAVFWIGYQKGKENSIDPAGIVGIQDATIINGTDSSRKDVDFSLFWNTWDKLKSKYVDAGKLEANKLVYGAIKGMLQSTGDPYTTFFDPEENKKFNEEISGSFEGIGAELGVKGGILTVIAPLAESPAEKAGLRAGDKIVKIDGKITSDMGIEDAVDLIRGQKGTEVTLTVFRNGDQDTQEIKVQRNVINVKSVIMEMKDGNVAEIKITRFGEDTSNDFSIALKKAISLKAKGIILDLRNNPGGYLNSSIQIASNMLPKEKIVVIEEDSKKNQKKMYTEGGDIASSIPTVVLINEGSASASEILAGALRENRENVTLIGKKSFGKGSVQEFISLPQGTAVKITIARWLTPNGNQINEQGISPDMEVAISNEDYQNDKDPQMDEALKKIKEEISKK